MQIQYLQQCLAYSKCLVNISLMFRNLYEVISLVIECFCKMWGSNPIQWVHLLDSIQDCLNQGNVNLSNSFLSKYVKCMSLCIAGWVFSIKLLVLHSHRNWVGIQISSSASLVPPKWGQLITKETVSAKVLVFWSRVRRWSGSGNSTALADSRDRISGAPGRIVLSTQWTTMEHLPCPGL